MTRVGRTDPLLRLLRERLQRDGAASVGRQARTDGPPLSPVERERAMAAMAAIDPEVRRKLLVRALLTGRLGEGVANDAAFQRLSERVLAMLDDTDEGRALVAAALADLEGWRA